MDRRRFAWAAFVPLALILIAGAEARLVGLTNVSLWLDETFSVSVARNRISTIVLYLHSGNDTHPPLYYVLLGVWIRLFGSGEAVVRGLSVIIGLLMIPLLYAFARRFVDRGAALLAAALLAGSAFAVLAAREARMYPLLGLLALGSWYALLLAVQSRRARDWGLYVLATIFMLYTHYYGLLVLASQILYLSPRWRDRRLLRDAGVALAAVGVLFSPWLPTLFMIIQSGHGWPTYRPPVDLGALATLAAMFGWGGELFGTGGYFDVPHLSLWTDAFVIVPVVGMAAWGAYRLRGAGAWVLGCYWAVPILVSAAVSQRANIFYPRYFSFLAPPFALLLAAGLDGVAAALLPRLASYGATRPALLAGLAVAVVGVNAPVINGRSPAFSEHDWRGAAALVTAEAGPRDYLLFVPGFARTPFTYYYKGRQERFELTPVEVYGMMHVKQAADPKINGAWAHDLAVQHPRVWIVATIPLPATAFVRLRSLLSPDFDAGHAWDFNSVYVIELQSRVFRAHGPPK